MRHLSVIWMFIFFAFMIMLDADRNRVILTILLIVSMIMMAAYIGYSWPSNRRRRRAGRA